MVDGQETLDRVTRAIQNTMKARRDRGLSRETPEAARAYAVAVLSVHLDILKDNDEKRTA